jgi:hypothetical protein
VKDTATTDTRESGTPPGTDAGTHAPRNPVSEPTDGATASTDTVSTDTVSTGTAIADTAIADTAIADDIVFGGDSAATTEHLRRLWMAGARDITVTYEADVVRHRTYLTHPRIDI